MQVATRRGAGRRSRRSASCSSAMATRRGARSPRRCSATSAVRTSRPVSAGTKPRAVHPLAVQVLAEIGIDWRGARAKPVNELLDRRFDYVITLSNSAREACPTLPGPHGALHWHLEDPAAVEGRRGTASRPFAPPAPSCPFACARSSRSRDAPRDAFPRSQDPSQPRDHRPARTERSTTDGTPVPRAAAVRPLAERVIPEPPRRGEPGGEPAACARAAPPRRSGATSTSPPPAGRRQPAGSRVARQPRARRLVQGPLAGGGGGLRDRSPHASSGRSSASAASAACTSIAGAMAAPISTSGSSPARSACSRRRARCSRSGRTSCRTSATRSSRDAADGSRRRSDVTPTTWTGRRAGSGRATPS